MLSHVDIVKQKRFLMIILDACRYDYFRKVYSEFLDGELFKIKSLGSCTPEWFMNTFKGYYDVVYVSANGFIITNYIMNRDGFYFEPQKHFRKIVNCFKHGWSDILKTVPAEHVVKCAYIHQYPRMIVHFIQPHAPYIGEIKLILNEKEITELVKEGILSKKEVIESYVENLRYVLKHVKKLLRIVKIRPAYITADHGELLFETGVLDHPCRTKYRELIEVPLLIVK